MAVEISSVSPAGEWELCGDRFYELSELYSLEWTHVRLQESRAACAPFGGPLAVIRDDRKMVKVARGETQPVCKIFTSSGRLLGSFVWERGRISAMGWSDAEDLLVVDGAGQVVLYSVRGEKLPSGFSMGVEVENDGVLEGRVWGSGVCCLTNSLALWVVCNLAEPRAHRLFLPGITEPPRCLLVAEPRHTVAGAVEVLLGVGPNVLVVDADSAHEQPVSADSSPLVALALSPNGQFLAAFSEEGRLMVWLADFTKVLSNFQTEHATTPDQLAWCGTDSVVIIWKDLMLMVGPLGDTASFPVDPPCLTVPEVDGVRLVGNSSLQLLRRVPLPLVDVFGVGSTAPGALLFDARRLFDQHDPRADEVLRSIVGELPAAVTTCCEAAGHILNIRHQTALMKAACYGRAFCSADAVPRRQLLEMCQKLRILNAMKDAQVGSPLTLNQLDALGLPALMHRLTGQHHHLLALRIGAMWGLDTHQVLEHWACAKISASSQQRDAQLLEALVAKLGGSSAVRFAAIAAHAVQLGRAGLAAMLLDHERVAAQQVPLLLELRELDRALTKAGESGDPDLLHLALFHCFKALPLQEFLELIANRNPARHLFLAYCRRQEPELLEQLFSMTGQYEAVAELKLTSALQLLVAGMDTPLGREEAVNEFVAQLEKGAALYAQSKEGAAQAKLCHEWGRLQRLQLELEHESGQAVFLGVSAVDTVRQCFRLGNPRAALKVKNEFRINDKQFAWVKLRSLASVKDWEALAAMAADKRLLLPLDVFISTCKAAEAPPVVTARFIARLTDPKRKAEEYAAVGLYNDAAETAAASKDVDVLAKIQGMVGVNSPLGQAMNQLKERLQAGGR